MDTITGYMGNDHDRCDDLFASAEQSVEAQDWEQADVRLSHFADALERHFAMEEKILFLAYEKAIGSSEGPTGVMRQEHAQIRAIMQRLHDALATRDAGQFSGFAETLNIMMQQHNMKEEGILYLLTDRALSNQRDEVLRSMAALGPQE